MGFPFIYKTSVFGYKPSLRESAQVRTWENHGTKLCSKWGKWWDWGWFNGNKNLGRWYRSFFWANAWKQSILHNISQPMVFGLVEGILVYGGFPKTPPYFVGCMYKLPDPTKRSGPRSEHFESAGGSQLALFGMISSNPIITCRRREIGYFIQRVLMFLLLPLLHPLSQGNSKRRSGSCRLASE